MAKQKTIKRDGFTLMETILVIAVIAILAAVITPAVSQIISSQREESTHEALNNIFAGIVGNSKQKSQGFFGDIGRLPTNESLQELLTNVNNLPQYRIDTTTVVDGTVTGTGVGSGWRGPYVNLGSASDTTIADAWGNAFIYNSTTGQIRSRGENSVDENGNGDDLVFPLDPVLTSGTLLVTVFVNDVPNPPGLTVKVFHTINGAQTVFGQPVECTTNSPCTNSLTFNNLSQGVHAVYAKHVGISGAKTFTANKLEKVTLFAGTQVVLTIRLRTNAKVVSQ
jgi:prepilin-type N-terminal cleavage/methylation domain-containing protein